MLDVQRATDGVDHAGKLDQNTVARGLDHASPMFRDLRVDQLAAVRLQARERALLVGTHETAVAGHVCGEDGGKLAFGALRRHGETSLSYGQSLAQSTVHRTWRAL